MKIIVITPIKNGVYKDDTEMFCEGFEKLGHEVVRTELWFQQGNIVCHKDTKFDETKFKGADVVWAPYEPLIPCALRIKEKFHIPAVGHWELIPPGLIPFEIVEDYWLQNVEYPNSEMLKKINNYIQYKFLAREFMECDAKTIIGEGEKYKLEKLLGSMIEEKIFIKPYPIDTEMLDKYKKDNVEEKYQICSILSLNKRKKLHHVIKALSLITNPPKLIVLGEGQDKPFFEELTKKLGVNVEFKGRVTDEEKVKTIQESLFTVHPWACLPAGEAAYLKKLSINYDCEEQRERLFNMVCWIEENNILVLSLAIQFFLEHEKERKEFGENAYIHLMHLSTRTLPIELACKKMLDIFNFAIQKYRDEQ